MIAGKELLIKMPQKWEIAVPFKYNNVLFNLECYIMYVIKGGCCWMRLFAAESGNQTGSHTHSAVQRYSPWAHRSVEENVPLASVSNLRALSS